MANSILGLVQQQYARVEKWQKTTSPQEYTLTMTFIIICLFLSMGSSYVHGVILFMTGLVGILVSAMRTKNVSRIKTQLNMIAIAIMFTIPYLSTIAVLAALIFLLMAALVNAKASGQSATVAN